MGRYQTKALNGQTRWNCAETQCVIGFPTVENRCRFVLAAQVLKQLPVVFTKQNYEHVRDSFGGFAPTLEWVRDNGLVKLIYTETFTIEKEHQTIEAKRNFYVIADSFKQDMKSESWEWDKRLLRNVVDCEMRRAQKKFSKTKAILDAINKKE